MLSGDQTHAI